MTTMKPEIKKIWVEELRSGQYRQGTGYLKQQHGEKDTPAYCCLGVLCEIAVKQGLELDILEPDEDTIWTEYEESYEVLPIKVQEWSGIDEANPTVTDPDDEGDTTSVADLNDNGKTFAELADIIEKEF